MKSRYMLCALALVVLASVGAVRGWAHSQTEATPITAENAAQVEQMALVEGHTGPVFSLAFSPDGATLVSGGSGTDYTARLWDVASASEKAVLEGHEAQIADVGFNADGDTALTASYDGTIKLWNAETGELIETQAEDAETGEPLGVQNLSTFFSDDGSKLAYGTDSGVGLYVWDVNAKTQVDVSANIPELDGAIGWIAFSADGKLAAAQQYEGPIHIIDTESAEEIITLQLPENFYYFTAMTFSPDGKLLAAAEYDTAAIQLWDVETGEMGALLSGHAANPTGTLGVYGLAFNPDGMLLASASYDMTIRIWDVAEGAEAAILEAEGDGPSAAAWSPDGALLATGDLNGSVVLWGAPGS